MPEIAVPITSPREVKIGDLVRITNRISHATGTETEQDRLATVTKVNRILIQVETDSGYKTSRIRNNLLLLIQ